MGMKLVEVDRGVRVSYDIRMRHLEGVCYVGMGSYFVTCMYLEWDLWYENGICCNRL